MCVCLIESVCVWRLSNCVCVHVRLLLSVPAGAVEDSWDPQSVSPWWQQVRNMCTQSQDAAAAALLAAIVAHRAAKATIASHADSKVS